MLKKGLIITLILALAFSLVGCGVVKQAKELTKVTNEIEKAMDDMQKWPKDWPGSIPKLDGKVDLAFDSQMLGGKDWIVVVNVKNKSAVTDYVQTLLSKGFKKSGDSEQNTNDGYNTYVSNEEYSFGITFSAADDGTGSVTLTLKNIK